MTTQKPLHVTAQLKDADIRGGLSLRTPHCIAYKLPKDTVTSILEDISKKTAPPKHESSVYTVSADWIQSLSSSIADELSRNFNAPPESFVETSKTYANIISTVGNGTWSSGITPINAIKDVETNVPLYISDYFDQLSGWAREQVFDKTKPRIGSIANPAKLSGPPGPETSCSKKFVKISWKNSVVNVNRSFNTSSNAPSFASSGEPSAGEVYRYFAFIDPSKQAISMNNDGSISKKTYNFIDSSQLWRIENYGSFYALYNKKYNAYLGRNICACDKTPDSTCHEAASFVVEDQATSTYSIGFTQNNTDFDYNDIFRNLTLVTVPLVAWRNSSGRFLTVDETHNGALGFSNGVQNNNTIIPKSEQLFLFVPHPDFSNKAIVVGNNGKLLEFNPSSPNKVFCSHDLKTPARIPFVLFDYDQNIWPRSAHFLASRLEQPLIAKAAPPVGQGTRVKVWKSDPSVQSVGIRELFLVNQDIQAGPTDSFLTTSSDTQPIQPDGNGDFLLDFDNTPSTVPESDNHVRFDVVHTFSVVRYTYDLLFGDLEYLDGNPPQLPRPWGNKKLVIHPHAGEEANAYYSRQEGVLKFFYTNQGGELVYLCRSLDVVAHETGHSILDTLQPGWMSDGQTGGFHEAFGDLCSLFVLISMAEIADLFINVTKANLRDPTNFLSAVGEEFGDALFKNKGKGLRNLNNDLKGSKAGSEVHAVSMVFSGFYYDVLVDVFALERNPAIKSDTETLMDVATNLRRALVIAIRVSSADPTPTKFQEIATNLETAFGTLGRRLGVDLTSWKDIVRKHASDRELSVAGSSNGSGN